MLKTYEKKDPYIGSIVNLNDRRYILLIFKVQFLFLVVYILFLTFTINT